MHTNRISLARKIHVWLALAAVALFAGCQNVTLTNLTAPSMPKNPSQIYTFSLRVTPRSNTVEMNSIAPKIVIDGQNFPMQKSPIGENMYDFEYQLPEGRNQVAYYFLVNYSLQINNSVSQHEVYTDIARANIESRYVLSLEVNRGPVGARISVLGRGFTAQDTILFNGQPARTQMESPNALSFYVPALDAGRTYSVTLSSPAGNSPVGSFRIDTTNLQVSPSSLMLQTGQRSPLTFTLPNSAPPGGTLLDVATDVPESVIMPEVVIPEGQLSVTVNVEGGKPGTGSLFLKGFGAGETAIPVTVTGR